MYSNSLSIKISISFVGFFFFSFYQSLNLDVPHDSIALCSIYFMSPLEMSLIRLQNLSG